MPYNPQDPTHVWARIREGGKELWKLFAYGEAPPYEPTQAFSETFHARAWNVALAPAASGVTMTPQPSSLQQVPDPLAIDYSLPDIALLDNPAIGGKVTVCVLCYGDYPDLCRRCLESILGTIPRHRLELRVATNAVSAHTLDYLRTLPLRKLYIHGENRRKYPVMREMLHDTEDPITTPYVFWFDDDTVIIKGAMWSRAAELIIANRNNQVGAFGQRMYHRLAQPGSARWFQEASWYHGRPLHNSQGQESPNGDCVFFPVGWFWIASMQAIRVADIPDHRILNNGDIALGEQLHQNGFKIKEFNTGKELVYTAKNNRRGVTDPFPWQLPPYVL